ncbi:hypothetical protein KIPB_006181 [Kipferlia bialata]|uniref:Uncharacterized protein n=1 Tax=Kipferlia bialata TaxID=797122 RepID=A0A9K3GJJ6_9EUKA|nr:hypothetical protein KIPB_006181 [Kipferlia bialata]|eukprot:g6181.t1
MGGAVSRDFIDDVISAEGALFLDSGLKGSVTSRNVKTGNKYSSYRVKSTPKGTLVITPNRLVLTFGKNPFLDMKNWTVSKLPQAFEFDDSTCTVTITIQLEDYSPVNSGEMSFKGHVRNYAQLKHIISNPPLPPAM